MTYQFILTDVTSSYPALEPLYRKHYKEMQDRMAKDGVLIGEFAPRRDQYDAGASRGDLLTFIVLDNGTVVGYSNVWLTRDMHNGELIAQEDTIYILPEHRNGLGKRLVKHILAELEARGVKRVMITPVTDLRVGKIWGRMGFKPVAQLMAYTFGEADVRP